MSTTPLRTPRTLKDLVICVRSSLLKQMAGTDKSARILAMERIAHRQIPTGQVISVLALWGNEFRHTISSADSAVIANSVTEQPGTTGNLLTDVWIAGLAEHLAQCVDEAPPAWCLQQNYFLEEPVFFGGDNFRAIALVETPSAWRRRNLFCGATAFS